MSVSSYCEDGTAKRQFKSDAAGIGNQQFVGHCFGGNASITRVMLYLNDYYNWHMAKESNDTLACSVPDI